MTIQNKGGKNRRAKPLSHDFHTLADDAALLKRDSDANRSSRLPRRFGAVADEKLQKILAALGVDSRRNIELLIEQGRVRVNGKTAHVGMRVKPRDRLAVDGKSVRQQAVAVRLLCYYKPIGKMVARGVENSVFEDLPPVSGGRWVNIGRLDVNSEGLLLFSTDGGLVQRLAHPRYAVEREYLARIDGELTPAQIKTVSGGVLVDGKQLKPAHFSVYRAGGGRNQWYRVILTEGRNRAVRRLFAHVGRQVSRLIRLRMGDFSLPRDLAAGKWQEIAMKEGVFDVPGTSNSAVPAKPTNKAQRAEK